MRKYTPEERQELLNKFYYMDTDGNGELSREEILQCLKESKLPKSKVNVSHSRPLVYTQTPSLAVGQGQHHQIRCLFTTVRKMKLSKREKQELLTKFYNMDVNNDGELSRAEIEQCLKESKLPSSVADEFLDLFDADGDGRVTLDEYERALGLKEIPETTIEDWKRTFEEMDTDKSGYLTVTEIHEGLKRIGTNVPLKDIAELVNGVDENGDGVLTVNEFTALMRLNTQTDS
ncbi:unnamed protein product [Mesocestoides corti]|uniref:EF-hand domain-containing protein n=2 Tax=Mesocestoides corti TaxID=53468 RepID=A0A0R3U728_MESCO|nr:unnamed protein product [Mesocestoides corti]